MEVAEVNRRDEQTQFPLSIFRYQEKGYMPFCHISRIRRRRLYADFIIFFNLTFQLVPENFLKLYLYLIRIDGSTKQLLIFHIKFTI